MNMLDLLRQAQGGNGIENLARQFGLGKGQTEDVLQQVLPAVSAGFKRNAQDRSGLEGILRQISGNGYEDIYDDPGALQRDDVRQRGNDVLAQIFGSKDVSRSVARKTEQQTGIGADLVKKMLPAITSMVLGGMQKKTTTNADMGGALGGLIGMLGGGGTQPTSGGGGLDDILNEALGGGRQRTQPQQGRGGLGDILGGLLGGKSDRGAQPRSGGGGLGDIFGGQPQQEARRAPNSRTGGGSLDDFLGGILGSSPRERQGTGDKNLDSVIGMFDSDGDGRVDMDILRQLAGRR